MATVASIYREALRLIGDHDIVDENEATPNRYVLDSAYTNAVQYCMSLGWWRFAFATTTPTLNVTSLPGYTRQFAKPADWLRTHSVCITWGTSSFPVDAYEEGANIGVKYTAGIIFKYVQNDIAVTSWPEIFAKMVAAYLAFEVCERITQSRASKADVYKIFQERLDAALRSESNAPPLRLAENAVEFATRHVLEQGFWRFSVVTVDLSHNAGLTASSGFTYRAAKPADWMRTYQVSLKDGSKFYPIDNRDTGGNLHADYTAFTLQYVSSNYLSPATWPEGFRQAVDAYLMVESLRLAGDVKNAEQAKIQYDRVLDAALAKDRLPRPLVLEEGAIRRATQGLLEEGLWKFSLKTDDLAGAGGTASLGYAYRFTKPADWLRTVRVFRQSGSQEIDIDFRDEGGFLHADYDPIVLRYVSTDAVSPVTGDWTQLFTDAWFALLRLREAEQNEVGANEIQARMTFYRAALKEAMIKDGLNERPKVNKFSTFAAARRNGYSGQQAR